MADFGYFSDTDESAVEDLISQAKELCVLEQVSAINCSSFTDSDLPPDLDSRFRRLKSFPAPKSSANPSYRHSKSEISKSEAFSNGKSVNSSPSKHNSPGKSSSKSEKEGKSFSGEKGGVFPDLEQNPIGEKGLKGKLGHNFSPSKQDSPGKSNSKSEKEGKSFSGEKGGIFPDLEQNPIGEKGLKSKLGHKSAPSPSNSSDSCLEDAISSPPKKGSKRKPKSRSNSSQLSSSKSWLESPSPPQKTGCLNLWCTPKRVSKKKSKEAKVINSVLDWEGGDEFLSDLNTFSAKEQMKILKKAIKEQERVSQEAAKIVKMAKQVSSRMSFHDIDDELSLSDDGSAK